MDVIQGGKPSVLQWNMILFAVVKIMKYKKSTIDHNICIKVLSDGNVSYIMVSADVVLNTTTNETEITKLRKCFEGSFEIKLKEGAFLV